MLLAYWYAAKNDDSDCYSIVGRTKKEVEEKVKASGAAPTSYEPPEKRVLVYSDGFDLMYQLCSEGGGYAAGMTVAQFKVRYPELAAKQ